VFLKNSDHNTHFKNDEFMIVDSETDFYFKPESIKELFEEDLRLKALEISKEQSSKAKEITANVVMKRKISDASNDLMTKYDVAEVKSKYSNARYLPIHQLRLQVKNMKQQLILENKENMNINNNIKNNNIIKAKNKFEMINNNSLSILNPDFPMKMQRKISENIAYNSNFGNLGLYRKISADQLNINNNISKI